MWLNPASITHICKHNKIECIQLPNVTLIKRQEFYYILVMFDIKFKEIEIVIISASISGRRYV